MTVKKLSTAGLLIALTLVAAYGDQMPHWWHPVTIDLAIYALLFRINLYRTFFPKAAHY